ncbi:MAG: GspH/FimT family pseudopilin [Acetobacteraceae bacterium]
MHHGRFGLAIAATALLVQGCADQQPSAPPARVFAADMAGAAKSCTVPPVNAAAGKTVDVAMKAGNDGGWCAVTVNNNGRPYDAGLLAAAPTRGKVLIHTVGNDTRIDYTPNPRYAGADTFTVRLIPGDATLRVAVTVTP